MTGYAEVDTRAKHLDLIQSVISRLGNNSFLVKGWTVTVLVGLFALFANRQTWTLPTVGLVPLLAFWHLDAGLLRQERLFRRLYESVRSRSTVVPELSMDVSTLGGEISWWGAARSSTLFNFYGTLVVVDILVLIGCLNL